MESSGNTLPRVLGNNLSKFVGKNVILVGEVLRLAGSSAEIQTPEGGKVTVLIPDGETFETKFVQIIGKVSFRNDIEAQRIQPMGDNFDLDLYRKAVDVTTSPKYAPLFV